jgi:MFS family permease
MRKWIPIVILGAAQFVMVLDSSVMNVSISQIVEDLHTTVQGVQLAITAYTLVMAALMLVGAKLGDIWGRDRVFAIGLGVYGLGSLTTALSPNLVVLLLGWSLVEGLGAVMVIPAIAALTVANYEGKARALAYGIIGGVAGAAIAAGPLIGGWVTTTWTWRIVFAAETVVVAVILLFRRRMKPAPKPESPPRLDVVGAVLSAAALGLIVFAVLEASAWGWITPRDPPTVNGHDLAPLGFSPVPFLILLGLILLGAFMHWEERRERHAQDTLLDRTLLAVPTLRAGLLTLSMQQLTLLGTFFVLPVYLQIVLGLDAFETGKRLFPMSISMLVAALAGPRLAARFAPKRVCQVGLATLSVAAFALLSTIGVELNGGGFAVSLALFGVGAGLLVSQLGNVIMSAVGEERSSEAGGLQGTAQNLGASLGTALIGAVLLTGLAGGFASRVENNPAIPAQTRQQIAASAQKGIDIVPVAQVQQEAEQQGLTQAQAEAVASDYGEAQLNALKVAMGAVAFLAIVGLWFTRGLPARSAVPAAAPEPEARVVLTPRRL